MVVQLGLDFTRLPNKFYVVYEGGVSEILIFNSNNYQLVVMTLLSLDILKSHKCPLIFFVYLNLINDKNQSIAGMT